MVQHINPQEPSIGNRWTVGDDRVKTLLFDSREWNWRWARTLDETHFFGYTKKKGYKIAMDTISVQSPFDKGYSSWATPRPSGKSFLEIYGTYGRENEYQP